MEEFKLPSAIKIEGITLMPPLYKPVIEKGTDIDLDAFLNKEDVVLFASYPRTGTTWVSHIISLLRAGEENYEEVLNTPIIKRAFYSEMFDFGDTESELDKLQKYKGKTIARTHLPYQFVNRWVERDQLKTIVTLRNPKDTMVSLYHFYKIIKGFAFNGEWPQFFEHVRASNQLYGDQIDWIESWWHQRNEDMLFVKYEDLIEDMEREIQRIADFLQLSIPGELKQRILKDASFQSMKSDSNTNFTTREAFDQSKGAFIRKGEVGQWKDVFTVAQNTWFDNNYGERLKKLEESGLTLRYSL